MYRRQRLGVVYHPQWQCRRQYLLSGEQGKFSNVSARDDCWCLSMCVGWAPPQLLTCNVAKLRVCEAI
jgi:hypothetical protein